MGRLTSGIVILAGAIVTASCAAQDPLQQLGVSQADARENLMNAVTAGDLPLANVVAGFKKLSAGARASVASSSLAWAKTEVNSEDFKKAYAAEREAQKPQPPTYERSVEDEFKAKQAKQEADLENARKSLPTLKGAERKQMETVIARNEKMMKDPDVTKAVRDEIESERAALQEGYQNRVKAWQTAYPENPNSLIAARLRRFLDASADVDFDAKLESRNGKNYFAKPEYEAKSSDWKLCFRAGRETVTAARTAATAWLKEIEGK